MLGDVVQRQNAKSSPAIVLGVLPFSGVNPGSTPGIPIFDPQNSGFFTDDASFTT